MELSQVVSQILELCFFFLSHFYQDYDSLHVPRFDITQINLSLVLRCPVSYSTLSYREVIHKKATNHMSVDSMVDVVDFSFCLKLLEFGHHVLSLFGFL